MLVSPVPSRQAPRPRLGACQYSGTVTIGKLRTPPHHRSRLRLSPITRDFTLSAGQISACKNYPTNV